MSAPRSVIVKTLVTTRDTKTVFDFFTNVKNWESGGALKNVRINENNSWLCDSPLGESEINIRSDEKSGVLDHDFIVEDVEWTVYGRITPNESGSTMSWLFIRPEPMTQEQFEEQLKNFDFEITGWKKSLES